MGFPSDSDGKESAYNAGDPGLIPKSGRCPGEGNGYPLWYINNCWFTTNSGFAFWNFLELKEFFFDSQLIESANAEPTNTDGQL